MRIPELLAPAGNMERLHTALHFGADAVYLGMQKMSLRNFADNFTMDTLHEACLLAHKTQKKIYVTVNAFAKDTELRALPGFLKDVQATGADALIVNDPGVILLAKEHIPDMPLHLSTQANTLNTKAALFWHRQGVSRIVLARELTLEEISAIRKQAPESLSLEMFVHGAMCVSYSGRCLLSNYIVGRDSNRGECAQPCRWSYEFREKGRDEDYFQIEQDGQGTYILNSRDMNLLRHIEAVCNTGVSSLKIEGRMKSVYYVAGVVNAYRMALDALRMHADMHTAYLQDSRLMQELEKVSHRPYSTGFACGDQNGAGQATQSAQYLQTHSLCAIVLAYDINRRSALIEQRNRFFIGERLEILSPGDIDRSMSVTSMHTTHGAAVNDAPHPKQHIWIGCDQILKKGDILRKKIL